MTDNSPTVREQPEIDQMLIAAKVRECDFNGTKYDTPVDGGEFIAQGATGRWCVVMCCGPEYIKEHGYTINSYDDAIKMIEDRNDGGYPDF